MNGIKHLTSFLLLLVLVFSGCTDAFANGKEQFKIALIGRYEDQDGESPSNAWFDEFTRITLEHYFTELNQSTDRVELELVSFNIHQDGQKLDSLYQAIQSDSSFLLVLDNTWAQELEQARETIKNASVPVISLNAYKADVDYGKNILFLTNFAAEFDYLLAYAKSDKPTTPLDIITEDDTRLHNILKEKIKETDTNLGETLVYRGQKRIQPADSLSLFNKLDSIYSSPGKDSGNIVLLNSHFIWGNSILRFLNQKVKNSTFLVWAIPDEAVIEELKNGNRIVINQRSPNIVSSEVLIPYRELKKQYPKEFEWPGAPGIMTSLLRVKNLLDFYLVRFIKDPYGRKTVFRMFQLLHNKPVLHKGNIHEVQENNAFISPPVFSILQGQDWEVSPVQLSAKTQPIPSIALGVDLKDVYDINFETTSFKADFEFWIVGDSSILKNVDELYRFHNLRNPKESVELISAAQRNGRFYQIYAVSGEFNNAFEGSNYPFDEQQLQIKIGVNSKREEVKSVVDPLTFSDHPDQISINGWRTKDYYVTIENSVRQDPTSLDSKYVDSNSLGLTYKVQRRYWSSILLIILPLLFIGLITTAILYVHSLSFSDMGEVIVGLFLSITAFSYALAELTPKLDTLTIADKLFLLTFLHVFTVFLFVIAVNSTRFSHLIRYKGYIRLTASILYPLFFFGIIFLN